MPDYLLTPARPHGELHAPPSKSAAHRALICAALSGEPCRVSPVSRSADMDATMGVLAAMGSRFTREQAAVVFSGAGWAQLHYCRIVPPPPPPRPPPQPSPGKAGSPTAQSGCSPSR